jgi:hypothetical protein
MGQTTGAHTHGHHEATVELAGPSGAELGCRFLYLTAALTSEESRSPGNLPADNARTLPRDACLVATGMAEPSERHGRFHFSRA